MSGGPRVSVVIPVWNAQEYLRQCLDSVLAQTIGIDRLEVIAVDDGSTDGSGTILDEYAARFPQVVVVHEPNSGGPGRPRNVGLERASGEYVFFLDADDYLGPEALERMVAMADRNGSDVVLGKMVGIDGRVVPTRAFRRNRERADITEVYSTLTVLKLFRRSLIERLGLRFQEGLAGAEDAPFTARAYLEAGTISVVADYDCYHCRLRPGSQTMRGTRDDLIAYLERIEGRIELVAGYVGPGLKRDRLLARHIQDVVRPFRSGWLELDDTQRRRVFAAGSALIERWHTGRIQRELAPWHAIRAHCLGHGLYQPLIDIVGTRNSVAFGDPLVEGGRVYLRWPHFRDEAAIPDSCFEITDRVHLRVTWREVAVRDGRLLLAGEAYLTLLGGSTTVVLRRWPRGPRYEIATEALPTPALRDLQTTYPAAGFRASIDLGTVAAGRPLDGGLWDVLVEVGTPTIRRRERFRLPKGSTGSRSVIHVGGVPTDTPVVLDRRMQPLRLSVGAVGRPTRWVARGVDALRRLGRPLAGVRR